MCDARGILGEEPLIATAGASFGGWEFSAQYLLGMPLTTVTLHPGQPQVREWGAGGCLMGGKGAFEPNLGEFRRTSVYQYDWGQHCDCRTKPHVTFWVILLLSSLTGLNTVLIKQLPRNLVSEFLSRPKKMIFFKVPPMPKGFRLWQWTTDNWLKLICLLFLEKIIFWKLFQELIDWRDS